MSIAVQLGRDLFNKAWDLIDRNDRSATDDNEMLLTAAAAPSALGPGWLS